MLTSCRQPARGSRPVRPDHRGGSSMRPETSQRHHRRHFRPSDAALICSDVVSEGGVHRKANACWQVSSRSGAGRERVGCDWPGRPVDQVDDDRVRGLARPDRWDRLLPAHAHAGRDARAARVGGCTDPAVRGRHDRRSVHNAAGRVKVGQQRRGSAVVTADRRQRRKLGRQCGCRSAHDHRTPHSRLAVVRTDLLLRVADAPHSAKRSRQSQASVEGIGAASPGGPARWR